MFIIATERRNVVVVQRLAVCSEDADGAASGQYKLPSGTGRRTMLERIPGIYF
jgi:hypothetical protein